MIHKSITNEASGLYMAGLAVTRLISQHNSNGLCHNVIVFYLSVEFFLPYFEVFLTYQRMQTKLCGTEFIDSWLIFLYFDTL